MLVHSASFIHSLRSSARRIFFGAPACSALYNIHFRAPEGFPEFNTETEIIRQHIPLKDISELLNWPEPDSDVFSGLEQGREEFNLTAAGSFRRARNSSTRADIQAAAAAATADAADDGE